MLYGKFWSTLEDTLIEKIVSLSIHGGINWFDTVEICGGGESERTLTKALIAAGKDRAPTVSMTGQKAVDFSGTCMSTNYFLRLQ